MIQQVLLPMLGETMESATIESWRKAEGDKVSRGDILCEITTDKATLEVESTVQGTVLKIIGQPGQELPVNALIAVVGDPGEAIPAELLSAAPAAPAAKADKPEAKKAAPAPAPKPAAPVAKPAASLAKPKAAPAPALTANSGRMFVSPRARKLAAGEHIPLLVLKGSGPEGRIVEADVKVYLGRFEELKVTPLARKVACERNVDVVALAAGGKKVTREDVEAAEPAKAPAAASAGLGIVAPKGGRVSLTPMRRIIAQRMLESKSEIPCYYLHMDVDFTDLMASRSKLNQRNNGGPRVSINDYIVVACAKALSEFPEANSAWDGDGILFRDSINVSIAVALEQGLIVPVVKNIEGRNLLGVAVESKKLIEKARGKKLLPDEYEGGAMTVSNLGMYGVKHFVPVVNPGESCILGLGIIEERVVVRHGGMFIRQMMTMTLACDHRLVDGAVGARFLERIRDLLEQPAQLEA